MLNSAIKTEKQTSSFKFKMRTMILSEQWKIKQKQQKELPRVLMHTQMR
jgi:hypothetical protein